MRTTSPSHNRRGLSLLELLVTLVIMGVIMGAAMNFFIGQSKTFRRGAGDVAMLQNIRFGADLLNQHFRAVGANVLSGQPPIIYVDQNTFAFNADYASNLPPDSNGIYYSIYYTPKAPNSEVDAIQVANQFTIPNTGVVYPQADYLLAPGIMGPAETIVFWFAPDTETARSDDYVLFRQVNNSPPEAVVRDILQDTVPFFQFMYLKDSSSTLSIGTVPPAELPLEYDVVSDTVKNQMLANLRAVLVSYIITNGLTGANERRRPMSLVAPFPNMEDRQLPTCGNAPVVMSAPTVTLDADGVSADITFAADGDETGGERDIVNYELWRRPVGSLDWGPPFASIPAGNPPTYTFHDATVPQDPVNDVPWEYAVAAQDCTPQYSDPVTSAAPVTIPHL